MKCQKPLTVMCVLLLLLAVAFPFSVNAAYIPVGEKCGFDNGCYISFDEAVNFTTAYKEPSDNATYGDFWFFGNTSIYGFHLTNCNATVDQFFSSSVLNFTLTQTTAATATVKVYVGSTLGEPNAVTGETSDSWNGTDYVNAVTVANPSSTVVTFFWADYAVTYTPDSGVHLINDLVNVAVYVARGTGEVLTNYELNVTKDGNLWQQNYTSSSFSDSESNIQSHFYGASELYDVDAGETVDFSITDVTVQWTGSGSGGSISPSTTTPSPTPPTDNQTLSVGNVTESGFRLPFNSNDALIFAAIVLVSVLIVVTVDEQQRKRRPKLKRFKGLKGNPKSRKGGLL